MAMNDELKRMLKGETVIC